jgi:hypothetical protein
LRIADLDDETDEEDVSMATGRPNGTNNDGSAARWQLMVSAAAVMTAIGGALMTLLVNINSLESTAANQAIIIATLERAATISAEHEVGYRTDIAGIRRDLVEVETQFCAEDAMRNLMHANDLRDFAMLWGKTMGSELPISNAFYPQIGRCQSIPH